MNKQTSVWAWHILLLLPNVVEVTVLSWGMGEWGNMAGQAFNSTGTGVSPLIRSLMDGNRIWKGRKRNMVLGRQRGEINDEEPT